VGHFCNLFFAVLLTALVVVDLQKNRKKFFIFLSLFAVFLGMFFPNI